VFNLDPDILILQNLSSLLSCLTGIPIVITPHITLPIEEDGFKPTEINIIQSGIYNLGFIALAKTPNTKKFLDWWQDRLHDKCHGSDRGMHVDQKWVDFVRHFYEGVAYSH